MSKRLNTPLIGVVLLSAFLWGNAYAVKGKYGFSPSGDSNVTGCTFDQTPLPIRVTRDHDTTNAVVKFNIFYVKDGITGMNDYIDFYTSLADHVPAKNTAEEDEQFWPDTPYMLKGRDKPVCAGVEECYIDLSHPGVGGYDMGRSRYDTFKDKYTKEELKIAGDIASDSGRAYRQYIDVRKIKFLRVEVFTPNKSTDSIHMGYTEPLYFEYSKVAGTNRTLALTSYGTTSPKDKIPPDEDLAIKLPKEINTNEIYYINVYINSLTQSAYQGKIPQVDFFMLSGSQLNKLSANCRSR